MTFSKGQKLLISVLLVFGLLSLQTGTVVADSGQLKADYVAVGDSLAAGLTPTYSFSFGYPDYISEKLADDGRLGTYKNFGVAGYTSAAVLSALKSDVVPDPYRNQVLYQIREAVSQAEIVTLDAGANDILKIDGKDIRDLILTDPNLAVYLAMVKTQEIGANTAEILKEIKLLNPKAKVYVMGYYNPFPKFPAQAQIALLLNAINFNIQAAAAGEGGTFVPTAETIDKNTNLYLPLDNIHPSKQGYMAIANQFWSFIKGDINN